MRSIILCAILAFANAQLIVPETTMLNEFNIFKLKYNKFYNDDIEEQFRFEIFKANYEYIAMHNMMAETGRRRYTLAVNKFADLTNAEFRGFYNGLKRGSCPRCAAEVFTEPGFALSEPLPTSVDWRTQGVVTPIKNQEQCGSCWAFSAVASLEGQHALATGKLVSLSEQNLVDCSSSEGNYGCEGGLMDQAFQYVKDAGGLDTEMSYPYKAIDEKCMFNKSNVGATLQKYTDVQAGSESALQAAVANVGPISVGIDASQTSFQFYSSGVYDEPQCSSVYLDHGVTAVGYGTQNNTAYWIVKNSWGTSWGQQGYILMSRNKNNQCGIATLASYPNV